MWITIGLELTYTFYRDNIRSSWSINIGLVV